MYRAAAVIHCIAATAWPFDLKLVIYVYVSMNDFKRMKWKKPSKTKYHLNVDCNSLFSSSFFTEAPDFYLIEILRASQVHSQLHNFQESLLHLVRTINKRTCAFCTYTHTHTSLHRHSQHSAQSLNDHFRKLTEFLY